MKKIEIHEGRLTNDWILKNPKKLFVLDIGDNRDIENVITFNINSNDLNNSFIKQIILIKGKSYQYESIVFHSLGYCKFFNSELINNLLKFNFDYDNLSGRKWFKIPSHSEIVSSEYLKLTNNADIINPINNSFFREDLIRKDLFTVFDLIKTENKISFTSRFPYDIGKNLILQFDGQKNYILCRVTCCYLVNQVSDSDWSSFEGYSNDFIVNKDGYYQIHIRYISLLDENGCLIFRDDLFTDFSIDSIPTLDLSNNDNLSIPENITNSDIYKLLLELSSKVDKLLK